MLPRIRELLDEKRLNDQGIFAPRAVNALLEEHVSGRQDLRKQLWTIVVLELWLESHVQQAAVHL